MLMYNKILTSYEPFYHIELYENVFENVNSRILLYTQNLKQTNIYFILAHK